MARFHYLPNAGAPSSCVQHRCARVWARGGIRCSVVEKEKRRRNNDKWNRQPSVAAAKRRYAKSAKGKATRAALEAGPYGRRRYLRLDRKIRQARMARTTEQIEQLEALVASFGTPATEEAA